GGENGIAHLGKRRASARSRLGRAHVTDRNGDRDYCASVNIARLGVAYLTRMKHRSLARSCSISDPRVKPVSYTGAGSALLLPPTSPHARPIISGKIYYYPGWLGSAFLQSSQKKFVFLRLCG